MQSVSRNAIVVGLDDGSGELPGGQVIVITEVMHGGASFKCKLPLGVRGCIGLWGAVVGGIVYSDCLRWLMSR